MIDLHLPSLPRHQTDINELIGKLTENRCPIGTDPFQLRELLDYQRGVSSYRESYLHHPERDFFSWKTSAHRLLDERLVVPHSLGTPLESQILSRIEHRDYISEEVAFTGTPPLRIPATVVTPKNGRKQHPAMIALHSMGGVRLYGREKLLKREREPLYLTNYRNSYYGGRSLQEELARCGFLSISIDAFNFGVRTSGALGGSSEQFESFRLHCSVEEANHCFFNDAQLHEPTAIRALECAGLSLPAIIATDDLRTVEYLLTRDDVDRQRVACIGFSFGGFRAAYLSALSSDIQAAVSVCWTSTMRGIVGYNVEGAIGFFSIPPGIYQHLDPVDIIAASAPKPFLAISAWQDLMLQPSAMAEAHLFLRETWSRLDASNQLGSLIYNTGHEFNSSMQEEAFTFLARHL